MISAIKIAYANIPSDRVILQWLVIDFCRNWPPSKEIDDNTLDKLPVGFVFRVVRRYVLLQGNREHKLLKDLCCLEDASEEEKMTCTKVHMNMTKMPTTGITNTKATSCRTLCSWRNHDIQFEGPLRK